MDLIALAAQIDAEISRVQTLAQLEEFRAKFAGRKGALAQCTAQLPGLPIEERRRFGREVNALKNKIESLIAEKHRAFGQSGTAAAAGSVDLGMPAPVQALGRLHPLTQTIDELCALFTRMGFVVEDGPEIETEFNNFTGLNIPIDHPSRDAFDTFYLKEKKNNQPLLLRSHTSPGQVRVMKSRKPPLAVIVPGRVYRPDAVDASHSFMFNQVEGFVVDTDIKFSDLKGVLETFAKGIFGEDICMRFRPHFFPFTEPSAEVDISCIICKGKGCSVCGRKGWLEILGAGMIHPNVFKQVGYDSKKYSGFAFGMGVERITMLKYGITDIRLFFENDLRFLNQF